MNIPIDKLTGNKEGDLDTYLLNSSIFSQEEREIVMEAVGRWLIHDILDPEWETPKQQKS